MKPWRSIWNAAASPPCTASTKSPIPKKVLEFEELAHAFGYSLGVDDLAERRIAVRHGQTQAAGRELARVARLADARGP